MYLQKLIHVYGRYDQLSTGGVVGHVCATRCKPVERWRTHRGEVAERVAHAALLEAARRVQELLLEEHINACRDVQMRKLRARGVCVCACNRKLKQQQTR